MQRLCTFEDKPFVADCVHDYSSVSQKSGVLVIDNGSHTCRAGWGSDLKPRLMFRNLLAKSRTKKTDEAVATLIGNDITELESGKWHVKTQFDSDVVTQLDLQEQVFDYIFSHLGIDSDGKVDHPLVLTEALAIPNTFRQYMSELLFECYNVPKVCYGIDALFSYRHFTPNADHGLVLSSGFQVTHVMPIVNGLLDLEQARRINLGGMNCMGYMQRLLQLKYPQHAASFNLSRAQELVQKHSYMAGHYLEELACWTDANYVRSNMLRLQLPVVNAFVCDSKERELRRQQAARLRELNQKKREEKLKFDEERLQRLSDLGKLELYNPKLHKIRMKQENLSTQEDVEKEIKVLKALIVERKLKIKRFQDEQQRSVEKQQKSNTSDVKAEDPTEGLSAVQIKELVSSLQKEKQDILDKQRVRATRKQALKKRKSFASKERMRILSQLAKGGGATKRSKEDTFGMNDDDWDVYKYIKKDGSDSDEEQEQERLNEIENLLAQSDPLKRPGMSLEDLAVYYQVDLTVERVRVPEIIYQPSLVGMEQGGLAETVDYVLRLYDADTRSKLVQNVFVTGGNTLFPGFKERLESELMALLPFESSFRVTCAEDPLLGPWMGAREYALEIMDTADGWITPAQYRECGFGYLSEHSCSNRYVCIAAGS